MKKYLLGLLFALMIATPVYSYTVQRGDTPYGLWGNNWKEKLSSYGIEDPTKLPVGLEVNLGFESIFDDEMMLGGTPTPTSSAAVKYVETPDFYAYSPAVAADTSITINNLEDIYGNTLTMTDFGDIGYGRIDPDGKEVSESFTFSGVTANSDGTYTLTGVKTALAKYPYTQTSGLVRSHSINAIVRFTNSAAFYDNFANKENDEIVDGDWEFTAFPYYTTGTTLPDADGEFATKYYVDTVGAGGFTSVNVSSTRGIEALGTSPETIGVNVSSTKGMYQGTDGQGIYQMVSTTEGLGQDSTGIYIDKTQNFTWTGTHTFNTTTNVNTATDFQLGGAALIDSDGYVNPNIIRTGSTSLNAGEAINGATLPVPVYQNTTDNELYACDGNDIAKLKYIGFAITNSTDGNPIKLQTNGIVSGFAGLEEGKMYFVQDAVGTIGTTAGTYHLPVGRAISETQLLIKKLPMIMAGTVAELSTTTAANNDVTVTLPFYPRLIVLDYFIQGHSVSTDQNQYLGERGRAIFMETTLSSRQIIWRTPNSAGDGLSGSDGSLQDALASLNSAGNDPTSTTSVSIGTSSAGDNDIQITLTINSVDDNGFVIRRATALGGGATTTAIARIAYTAYE